MRKPLGTSIEETLLSPVPRAVSPGEEERWGIELSHPGLYKVTIARTGGRDNPLMILLDGWPQILNFG